MAPGISVVTPSYNQADYLEETIQSVLSQSYPHVEYIVMDGGSTDGSVKILERYDEEIDHWVSEPDDGQTDAIAKGFDRASGDILCWLNSDDLMKPGTLNVVAGIFENDPELDLIYGDTEYLYPDGSTKLKPRLRYEYPIMLYAFNLIPQPSSFFTAEAYGEAGGLDPDFDYTMDYDLFLRMGPDANVRMVPVSFSSYRLHPSSKTVAELSEFEDEWRRARERALDRELGFVDRVRRWAYTAKVVWKFWRERGVVKLSRDTSKWNVGEAKEGEN